MSLSTFIVIEVATFIIIKGETDMFASLVLGAAFSPTGLIIWLIIGLIAGFIASRIMSGGGYGLVGDLISGLVGGFIGGILVNLLVPDANFGFWGSVIVSIIGACIVIAIVRAVAPGSRSRM
jgi:uncharacterized membrane protein YeaQ/YmgE (transglycosylase-associated protein family)